MNSQKANLNEMEDIKDRAPKLSGINPGNPFGVPKNYFDDFYARLETKLEPAPIVKKPNAFVRYMKPVIGLAAGFALVFTLLEWPLNVFNKHTDLSNYSIENTLENQYIGMLEDVDDNSLFALLENGYQEDQITDEVLTNYLTDNLSDYDVYMEISKTN